MDANQIEKLKALAQAYVYENGDHWYNEHQVSDGITYEPAKAFIEGCSPAAVLDLASAIPEPESVPIPTTVNMARMMVALGCVYLKDHAPEHLAAPAAGTVEKDAERLADGYQGSTMVSDLHGPKITMRYATSAQAEAAHAVIANMIDAAIEAHTKAGKANA